MTGTGGLNHNTFSKNGPVKAMQMSMNNMDKVLNTQS
jgi:hypothetical protein